LPGSKVVKAFNLGFNTLDDNFDVICKFDADLIFPKNYLEKISLHFDQNLKTGMDIFTKNFSAIKGMKSGSYNNAANDAINKTKEKIINEIIPEIRTIKL